MQFTPVLALYDPFGVDVPLNLDNTHFMPLGKTIKYLDIWLHNLARRIFKDKFALYENVRKQLFQ